MHLTLIVLGILSGVCIYVGLAHAFDTNPPNSDHRIKYYSLYSILAGFYGIVLAIRYQLNLPTQQVTALKFEISIIALMFLVFPRFVKETTGVGSRRLIQVANILVIVVIVANLISPYSLQYSSMPNLVSYGLLWGENIWLPSGVIGTWFKIGAGLIMLLQIYAIYAFGRMYQTSKSMFALLMLFAVVLTFAASIQGILVRFSVIETVHLGSIGVLTMVIVMSAALSQENKREQMLLKTHLHRTREQQKAILEYAGYAIISGTPEGIITSFNPAAEKMLGYSAEEMIGRNTPEIFHDPREVEERARQFSTELKEMLQPGFEVFVAKARHGLPNEHEWTYIRKDGTRFPAMLTVTALRDDAGKIIGFLGIANDISERNQALKALRESEEKYRLLFENMTTAFALHEIIVDDNGKPVNYRYLEINPAFEKLTGVRASALMGKTILEVLPNTEQYWIDVFGKVALTGEPTAYENFSRELGRYYDTWVFSPRKNQFAVIFSDSTERKHAEAELKRHREHLEELVEERTQALAMANRELEAFSYSVSHDLRAPLRSIDGFSQILSEDYATSLDSTAHNYLQRIRNSSQRMGTLIDDLLQLARIGRAALSPTEVDLSRMASEIVAQVLARQSERNVNFQVEPNMIVRGDAQLLNVALTNLLDNAFKYTSRVARAEITFGRISHQGDLVYFVRDNGIGFDMQYANQLFDAFQRLHNADEFPGTGIGLATVRRIIQRHGGRVWVEAEWNKGATFFFTLPLNQTKSAKTAG
jgi:PAS domain S-box-containing protein